MDSCPRCDKDLRPGAIHCACGWELPAAHKRTGVRSTSVVEEIRAAYENSPAFKRKFPGHVSESMKKIPPREPGEEG